MSVVYLTCGQSHGLLSTWSDFKFNVVEGACSVAVLEHGVVDLLQLLQVLQVFRVEVVTISVEVACTITFLGNF